MTDLQQHSGRKRGMGLPVLAAAVLAVLALVIVGCSSSTTTTAAPPSSASSTTTGASGGGSGAATEVAMKDIAFSPQTVTIKAGDTVTWTNKDTVVHDVTAGDGSFKSGVIRNGGTFSHTFAQAGTYEYTCTIHPGMTGTVVVQ